MARRRFARGVGNRRKRRLTWRANANRAQLLPNGSGTPAMFPLRPSAGWENTEPTLMRIRGEIFGAVAFANPIPPAGANAGSAIFGYGLVMGQQPNGFLNGVWSSFVPVDVEDEQVLWIGRSVLSLVAHRITAGSPTGDVSSVSIEQVIPTVIDSKARRKIRAENDELWLSAACFGAGSLVNASSPSVEWWMRFLYAVDF